MFYTIPTERPHTPLLDTVIVPSDLRQLSLAELDQLVDELRHFLLYTVGQTGGHFGAGMGVVELTVALHHIYNTPFDRVVWDVGHQTYPHKILTGRIIDSNQVFKVVLFGIIKNILYFKSIYII